MLTINWEQNPKMISNISGHLLGTIVGANPKLAEMIGLRAVIYFNHKQEINHHVGRMQEVLATVRDSINPGNQPNRIIYVLQGIEILKLVTGEEARALRSQCMMVQTKRLKL